MDSFVFFAQKLRCARDLSCVGERAKLQTSTRSTGLSLFTEPGVGVESGTGEGARPDPAAVAYATSNQHEPRTVVAYTPANQPEPWMEQSQSEGGFSSQSLRPDVPEKPARRRPRLPGLTPAQSLTTMNDKFTEVLKDIANIVYCISKESKDIQAQIKWGQQAADRVHKATEHLPDGLGILKNMLLDSHGALESLGGCRGQWRLATRPAHGTAGQFFGVGGSQQGHPHPNPSPTMLNLDEPFPVQVNRPSVLTPITLSDGRVCYIPRAVVQRILGHI